MPRIQAVSSAETPLKRAFRPAERPLFTGGYPAFAPVSIRPRPENTLKSQVSALISTRNPTFPTSCAPLQAVEKAEKTIDEARKSRSRDLKPTADRGERADFLHVSHQARIAMARRNGGPRR
ncbi:MAG: hypothetical protein AAF830_10205 [Pseudomonadota bacterium]